jgi:hypothetical protein
MSAISSFLQSHWTSLVMLCAAVLGILGYSSFLSSRASLGQQMRIPEWAVTIGEKAAQEKQDREAGCFLFLLLFGPAAALFVLEFFSANWGVWFLVTRIIVMLLQLCCAAFVLYWSVGSPHTDRL